MPKQHFQVPVSLKPKAFGEAELVLPKILQDLECQYVIVKDGGQEAIVRVEAPDATLEKVGKSKGCQRLTPKQMENLRKDYPAPKVKVKYRRRTDEPSAGPVAMAGEMFELDEQGNKVLDTFQTVRSGFYLIDVPIVQMTEKVIP